MMKRSPTPLFLRLLWVLALMCVVDVGQAQAIDASQALKLARKVLQKDIPRARVAPIASANVHLKNRKITHPLKALFFFAGVHEGPIDAPKRRYLAVRADGKIVYPLTKESAAQLLGKADRKGWSKADYLAAAQLYIHLSSVVNEDGWVVVEDAKSFLRIKFNMSDDKQRLKLRKKAAAKIRPPRLALKGQRAQVVLHSWHLIGGELKRWKIGFDHGKLTADVERLGRFGGGGYD